MFEYFAVVAQRVVFALDHDGVAGIAGHFIQLFDAGFVVATGQPERCGIVCFEIPAQRIACCVECDARDESVDAGFGYAVAVGYFALPRHELCGLLQVAENLIVYDVAVDAAHVEIVARLRGGQRHRAVAVVAQDVEICPCAAGQRLAVERLEVGTFVRIAHLAARLDTGDDFIRTVDGVVAAHQYGFHLSRTCREGVAGQTSTLVARERRHGFVVVRRHVVDEGLDFERGVDAQHGLLGQRQRLEDALRFVCGFRRHVEHVVACCREAE